MSTGPGHTHMFNIQNIYATPPVSRRQVIKPRRLTLIDLRNVTGAEEEGTQRKGSSGTIKSESGISNLKSAKQICDVSEAPRRPVATMKVKNITTPSSGFSVANSGQVKLEQTRFPKLEEYAHFHYDLVEIPTLKLSLCTDDASGYKHNTELSEDSGMFLVTVLGSAPKSWLIKRSLENFATLDIQLHRCIFDRRFSRLNDLSAASLEVKPRQELLSILHSYLTHLSELAGGMINCGSVLSWMEMDNRGHRLVATDDSGINTPAIAAAHVIKRYSAQAADEITLQVGDMISVIDMPSAEDTIWWRGKRGFEVGFFPAECVEIIGDKIPTSMATRIPEPVATASASRRPCEILEELSTTTITATPSSSSTPSPSSSRYSSTTSSLVGNLSLSSSSAESSPAMMKKHGKLLSFLRTFFSHRPPRNQLKQSGIVKERVFGCDLGEHLLNSGHDVPLLLKSCTDIIEEYGIVHGIYRLSGITSNIQKLRLAFDEDRVPDLTDDCYLQDIHSISSLLKMYFRELPNPLLTYQLYDKFADAVRDEDNKLLKIHDVVQQLPPPHYRTTEYLMRHLARVAAFGHETEMHSKNLAIVWAPNLLRSKELEAGGGAAALQGVGIQAVVTECLICYCDIIFSDKLPDYSSQDSIKGQKKARPKSLAISTPTRLLSLEEARERAFVGHMAPKKFIDVGGGPRNLPSKYHTVIDLPGYRKRAPSTSSESKPVSGNKKASTTCGGGGGGGGWKSIFIKPRSGSIKKSRKCAPQDSMALNPAQGKALTEEDVHNWKRHLRSAKSAESLFSLMNTHSSHGSLSSRTSASASETVSHVVPELASKFQLSHKRSLSSDASTVLHHCCSTTGEGLQSQSPDDQDKQSFKRGDSARKALHRRLPSAPSTPLEDRKSVRETVSSVEAGASGDMSSLDFSHSQYDGDMNIHAKINSRLLQVAEKSRSAKSQEEFTSPLKRMANCSPKGSKKAKGAGDFQMGSSDDELSNLVTETKVADSSSCVTETSSPNHSSGAVRAFYSRVHDYAEIVSDDDLAVLSTPDSQGAMSVSSSGCNMQDVLDQIDTRLALNAKLFPRQGIGDTSGYRVGDPPLSCVLPRSKPTTGLDSDPALAVPTSVSQETAQTELSVCADDLYVTDLPRELCQSSVDDSDQHMLPTLAVRQEHNNMRTGKTTASSTLVGRRHTEFIPSMTAAAKDLHNLHELLNSLTADDSQARVRVLSRNQKSSRNSIVHTHHDHSATRMSQQKPPLSGSGSQFAGTQVPGPLAHVSAGVGGGGMSKCLSVPSDIARSLENVTGSQSDLLSSVTISELSASINSFSNGLGQEAAIVADAARAQIESADRRHRRSTSLDSLTENDRLMTRTLREINSQMEAAFQHNKVSSSGCSLDSLAHHQRLAVSDLELTSAGLSDHRATLEITADVNHRTCSHNHLYFSQSKMATSGRFDGSHPSAETAKSAPAHKLSHETVNSHDFVSETRDSVTAPCHLLSIVDKHAICDLSPTSCFISSQLNPGEEQQLCEVRQPADFNDVTCLDSTCDQQSRLTEKQTHRQNDEHIVIETTHVVKFKSPQPDRTSQQYRHPTTSSSRHPTASSSTHPTASSSRQQHAHSRSDIASVCTNRSSSSSGTSSEDYDEVAELSEDVSHMCHFSLPLGTVLCPTGNICGVVDNLAAGSTVQPAHNSTDRQHQAALHVSLPASDSAQYQVVRRQHSPRVEQKSQRFHLNIDGTKADFDDCQDSVATNDRWKPLFTSDSHVDDSETCERMSSLCAVGLMSQRARLSRDSSVSSLHSPDTCSPCVLASSAQSPLTTPVREALPDLIQSTAQTEATDADNRRCSAPLQLALYHPDEFSVDIAASVSSYTPSSRSTPLHPSASLPQVHSLSHTVVVTKSTLTKSSTDNSLCEVTRADRTVSGRHPGMAGWHRREADSHDLMLDTFDVADTQTLSQSVSFSYTDPDGIKEENISKQNMQACRDEAYDGFNQDLINKHNHMLRPSRSICSQDFSSQVAVEFNNLSNRPMDDHQAAHFADSQPQASAIDSKLPLLLSSTDREPASSVDSKLSSSSTDREPASAVDSQLSSSSTDREPASAVDSQLSSSSTDREPASAVDSQLSSSSTDREPASAVDSQLSSSSTDREMHHTDHMAVGIEVMETGPPCTDDKYALRSHASLDTDDKYALRSHASLDTDDKYALRSHASLDTDDKYALRSHASPDTDAQMFFLYNSDPAMEKEEVQNVVNQGREILMSPELIDKSEQREKYQSLQSPSTGPVRRTSFSKIPRPRQNTELTSPRPANNGGRKNEFLYSSPMTSSVHVDTSPSSSSSSTSSSSRVGHTRRGSEASHGSTTNRQCHIRRSSDTKLTDLQTVTPASRGNSSSSNRPDLSGTGRPVTSPRNRGSEYKTVSTDIGVKSSRIPLSHRIPSPQSNRGTDSTNVAISKQISKIPSPVPKPRKLNLNPKGSLTTVPVEGNSCVRQCKTDTSGRVSSSKTPAVKRDAESNSKKAMIVKDMPSKCGAQLLIESQSDMTKAQTIHATKVSLPTRQVAGPEPAAEPSMASVQLEHENSTLTVTSGEIARTQSHLQTEVRAVGGDRKTPPPVAARQFTYDSRSLPRRSKLLETQVSFPGQQSCCELYSDMLGSRSSLDDSVLQLAAERHDLFVPGVSENGGSCGNCLSSLRVKRSQKMQSLMDLFERGSDSNVSDSSGPHSPGTQHRVRTCSGSVSVQGGMLTPCVEAGLGDLSTVDDDTFWPPTSECDDTWSRERFPSRAGTCSGHDDSSQEKPDSGGQLRVQGKHHACMCTSVIQPPGRETFHGSRAEQRSVSRKQATETTTCQRSPSTFDSCSNNLKPPYSDQPPGSRTRSNSSSDPCTVHPVFTSRPSSFSGTDLQLRAAGHPHLTDTHLALAFDRQHPNFAFIDPAHRQTDMAHPLYEIDHAHHADSELHATVTSSLTSSGNTPPASPRKNTERRNSIKELRQLFERGDADVSTATDNGLSNSDGQPTVARSRVRSISPQTDHGTKRDQLVRLSLEIASSTVACQSSQSEIKLQPLRLGPKPFYGAHK